MTATVSPVTEAGHSWWRGRAQRDPTVGVADVQSVQEFGEATRRG